MTVAIRELQRGLASGALKARALVEEALARIAAAEEAGPVFLHLAAGRARAEADDIDRRRAAGDALGPLAGIPIAVKDLYDIAGEPTRAGSMTLADAPPAARDGTALARLRAAGAIVIGRTNMSEFAFWGVGVNPHHGTPLNPWDRAQRRVPGGSSSGAAVSVAEGMCAASLGSDTGGSIRIPAALCGVAGFKSTAARLPRDGVFPLSPTLDSLGPLAGTIDCCAILDAVMAGAVEAAPALPDLSKLRLAAVEGIVTEDLDAHVATAYERALARLAQAGARIEPFRFPTIERIQRMEGRGTLGGYENFAVHRERFARSGSRLDPMVLDRLQAGSAITDAAYHEAVAVRAGLIAQADAETQAFDAMLMPTCPIAAPRLAEVASLETFTGKAQLLRRNTTFFNFLDRCAATFPIHVPGEPPVGLMVAGHRNQDRELLAIARLLENSARPV